MSGRGQLYSTYQTRKDSYCTSQSYIATNTKSKLTASLYSGVVKICNLQNQSKRRNSSLGQNSHTEPIPNKMINISSSYDAGHHSTKRLKVTPLNYLHTSSIGNPSNLLDNAQSSSSESKENDKIGESNSTYATNINILNNWQGKMNQVHPEEYLQHLLKSRGYDAEYIASSEIRIQR